MHERHWDDLGGLELRYRDHTWELTGDVEILRDGALIGAEVRQVDGTRHGTAQLFFAVENPPRSVNPGDLGDHFQELVKEDGKSYLKITSPRRTYRYELQRLERG
jgi:hypothetical protein